MKILLTFEDGRVALHFVNVIRMLKSRGHELFYYGIGTCRMPSHHLSYYGGDLIFLESLGDPSRFDMWMYDLTSWDGGVSPFIPEMKKYNGKLVCICNADGAGFMIDRTSEMVRLKTSLFMRNTLFVDRSRYPSDIHSKLFLSTCYINNSQDFKNSCVPFRDKQKRAIFTGSLTGFSETKDMERYFCRIRVPMALIEAEIPCVYRMHNHNPDWKKLFDERVPVKYQTTALSRPDFVKEMETSMIVLALRGNYHTVNRFFEGQASGGLVFTTRFKEDAEFLGHGEPGVHYVEIEWDGSDVVEKARYYLEHLDEAEIIARNGRALWEEQSMLDENKVLPSKVIAYYVKGMKEIGGIEI